MMLGVIERGSGFGLLDEALCSFQIGDAFGRKNLDCDETVEVGVAGFINRAHAAFPE